MVVMNPRQHRRSKRTSRRSRSRRRSRNTGDSMASLRRAFTFSRPAGAVNPSAAAFQTHSHGLVGNLTAGFKTSTFMNVLPIPIGGFANHWLQQKVASQFGVNSWYGRAIVGLATSGVLGAASAMFRKNLGAPVGIGAAAQTLVQAIADYKAASAPRVVAAPAVAAKPAAAATAAAASGANSGQKLSDFDDINEDDALDMD